MRAVPGRHSKTDGRAPRRSTTAPCSLSALTQTATERLARRRDPRRTRDRAIPAPPPFTPPRALLACMKWCSPCRLALLDHTLHLPAASVKPGVGEDTSQLGCSHGEARRWEKRTDSASTSPTRRSSSGRRASGSIAPRSSPEPEA